MMWWSHLPSTKDGDIEIQPTREEVPRFERVYKTVIGDGFTVEVKMYTAYGSRMDSSMLTQKNGRWISFDVQSVADKIIDRELYPLVQAVVDKILELDAQFIKAAPDNYVDEGGYTWSRT